jgi:hypothetical protein
MIQEIATNVGFFLVGMGIMAFFKEELTVGGVTFLGGFLMILFGVR